ncbi:MAG: hypothetical protein IKD12_07075 [Paludibacteraceae bacterium]|nr:hypothetical protein [Paludibacteraceae bacterium]
MTTCRKHSIFFVLCFMGTILLSCAKGPVNEPMDYFEGAPRLIIKGHVKDEADEPLRNIHVYLDGVDEPAAIGYNEAYTDSLGGYLITRYLGRSLPDSLVIIASDTASIYEDKLQKLYKDINYVDYNQITNDGGLKVDFELKKKE